METVKLILETASEILAPIWDAFNSQLFKLGKKEISLNFIIGLVGAFLLLFYIANKAYKLLANRILSRYKVEPSVSQMVATIVRYFILIVGFFIVIHTAGIDLSALGFAAGALGVGIGFGLQNITNNFISGIIILFERPIKIGDRVEVGTIKGDVQEISARATTIITNDNISLIVPNAEFVSNTVINWSHNDRMVRFSIPVGVSYKEDPKLVRKVVLDVVNENSGVLKKPPAELLFSEYGDNSINFELIIWTTEFIDRPKILKSQLYYAIFKKFKDHHIQIPFPQRDLHLVSGFESEKQKTEQRILDKLKNPDYPA